MWWLRLKNATIISSNFVLDWHWKNRGSCLMKWLFSEECVKKNIEQCWVKVGNSLPSNRIPLNQKHKGFYSWEHWKTDYKEVFLSLQVHMLHEVCFCLYALHINWRESLVRVAEKAYHDSIKCCAIILLSWHLPFYQNNCYESIRSTILYSYLGCKIGKIWLWQNLLLTITPALPAFAT